MRFLKLSLLITTSVAVTAHPILLTRDSGGQGSSQDRHAPQEVDRGDDIGTTLTKDFIIGVGVGASGIWSYKKYQEWRGKKAKGGAPGDAGPSVPVKRPSQGASEKIKALKEASFPKRKPLSPEERLMKDAFNGRGWIKEALATITEEERDLYLDCYKREKVRIRSLVIIISQTLIL